MPEPFANAQDARLALEKLEARDALVLRLRVLEGRPAAEVCAFLGVPDESLALSLAAAAGHLAEQRRDRLSLAEAHRLGLVIDGRLPATSAPEQAVEWLGHHAAEVLEAQRLEAVRYESSAEKSRADWLRRLALWALVAVTAWLFYRERGFP